MLKYSKSKTCTSKSQIQSILNDSCRTLDTAVVGVKFSP